MTAVCAEWDVKLLTHCLHCSIHLQPIHSLYGCSADFLNSAVLVNKWRKKYIFMFEKVLLVTVVLTVDARS